MKQPNTIKKTIKKQSDEKHLNNILINILSISITLFIALGSGIYFLAKIETKIDINEENIKNIKIEMSDFKNDLIEINKLNNSTIDNKIYIYMNYINDEKIDKLLKITDDEYDKQIDLIINKKSTN